MIIGRGQQEIEDPPLGIAHLYEATFSLQGAKSRMWWQGVVQRKNLDL